MFPGKLAGKYEVPRVEIEEVVSDSLNTNGSQRGCKK